MATKGSKNAPENRGEKTNRKVILLIEDGKKKMCFIEDNKLIDKSGNVVGNYEE